MGTAKRSFVARSGVRADGGASGDLFELARCTGLCGMAVGQDGQGLSLAERGGMGIFRARPDAAGKLSTLFLRRIRRPTFANTAMAWTRPVRRKFRGPSTGRSCHAATATLTRRRLGSFRPNAFGLFDMHGNVWQWVEDCYRDTYEGAPGDGRAWTEGKCDTRVLRGGSWYIDPGNLRAAYRDRYDPDDGTAISASGWPER